MTKLEYYLILIAARITGDLLTGCLRRLKEKWQERKNWEEEKELREFMKIAGRANRKEFRKEK